ncbi:hypothetical protein A4X09_0g7560 [Tilletia walkeri]|uniref:Uncharacterized protein n=1 Tax=Tilletia walkeri TaxID=117179 RepID=A0A8X7N393_9BASI|nr:hypothetical protein A4X09_0g7560 [Tilletia walkeri]
MSAPPPASAAPPKVANPEPADDHLVALDALASHPEAAIHTRVRRISRAVGTSQASIAAADSSHKSNLHTEKFARQLNKAIATGIADRASPRASSIGYSQGWAIHVVLAHIFGVYFQHQVSFKYSHRGSVFQGEGCANAEGSRIRQRTKTHRRLREESKDMLETRADTGTLPGVKTLTQ